MTNNVEATMGLTTYQRLKGINVNDKKEKKGNFDYLSWTDAIDEVQKLGVEFSWELLDDVHYPDGSMEVRVAVTIEGTRHVMWLAVMDNRNQAIKKPDAAAINKARMRCLVKGIAVHGLGFYIFKGEDLPDPDPYSLMVEQLEVDPKGAIDGFMSMTEQQQAELANAAPYGKKVEFKKRLAALEAEKHQFADQVAADIQDIYSNWQSDQRGGGPDNEGIVQILNELSPLERRLLAARLGREQTLMVQKAKEKANG